MKIQSISISLLQTNKGQIEGLPKNPRKITAKKLENLKRSIEDAPEMLSLRELIVYPYEGKYIVIGGNMRLRACSEIGYTELPCKVLDESTPVEKLREYVIKDNVEFGENDLQALEAYANEEFMKYCIDLPTTKEVENEATAVEKIDITPPSQYYLIKIPLSEIAEAKKMKLEDCEKYILNEGVL